MVTSTPSDSHTWNLVFLQLVLEECGYIVRNLGACPSVDTILGECRRINPDLVVVSSVNGHGRAEGADIVRALRAAPDLPEISVVIGGMLTTGQQDHADVEAELLDAGYSGVFIRDTALADFHAYLSSTPALVGLNAG